MGDVDHDQSVEDAGSGHEQHEGAPPPRRRLDVRAVLDEIGAEDAIAHLEARVAGLEQDLERSTNRSREAERTRRSDLELIRARVEDTLGAVREAMEEQRVSLREFDERFSGAIAAAEEAGRAFVDQLREDLTPRVQRAVHHVDEAKAELRGELAAIASDAEGRASAQGEQLATLRRELERSIAQLRSELATAVDERTSATVALEERLVSRLEELERSTGERFHEQQERTEALRRELDATAGELRAGMNLTAGELRDALGELHAELGQAIDDQSDGAAELERRWIAGTEDIGRRFEQVERMLREAVEAERAARRATEDELTGRVEAVNATVDELHDRGGTDSARREAELEGLRRGQDELVSRLDVLQSKVAKAVGQVASQLSNRVAQLAGDLDAMRESSVRQQERLASVDHVERRLAELAASQEQLAARTPDAGADDERLGRLETGLAELRREVGALTETVTESRQQSRDVAAGIGGLTASVRAQESLRQEVRELAARTAETVHRLDETEKLARAAGQAIASAVRRSRGEGASPPRPRPVPAAGETIFGDRPRTVRRDDEGRPIVGMEHLAAPRPTEDEDVSAEDLRALEEIDAAGD